LSRLRLLVLLVCGMLDVQQMMMMMMMMM